MRTLVISDLHSNLVALHAVLDDAATGGGYQQTWCLGDIVGYGPEPVACVDQLRALNATAILGNHDAGAIGTIGLERFNDLAAWACRWTTGQLTPEARRFLESLPLTLTEVPFTLVHGAPRAPLWEYLLSASQAAAAWEAIATPAVLVGHSHLPFFCQDGAAPQRADDGTAVPITDGRLVINPGSVGQPRDGDPRAAYAVYDDGESIVEMRRVSYDVAATQRRMQELGLPEPLIARLARGQ